MKDLRINDEIEVTLWGAAGAYENRPVVEGVVIAVKGRPRVKVTHQVHLPLHEFRLGKTFLLHPNDVVRNLGGLENE